MQTKTRDEHLFDEGPKRILALDGGGIRGILTLQILRRIEELVRERTGNRKAVLSDYFDLIGGTSTGAIIAAALALGWDIDRIDRVYRELGDSIFEDSLFRKGLFRAKFPTGPLEHALEREIGDVELGDPDALKTGFAMVAKRLDTGSPWVLHNNPRGPFFDQQPGSGSVPNRQFKLRQIVRASTAAPTYFVPEKIEVADGVSGAFVDGGVSPHNNPSLQLLMLATLAGHGLNWNIGADELLVVSLGTGSAEPRVSADKVMGMPAAALGIRALSSLMDDASALNEQLMQWLSTSPTARPIDREVGDLGNDVLGGGAPWLTYLRYDVTLDRDWVKQRLGLDLDQRELDEVHAMDEPANMDSLANIGAAAAANLVANDHFPAGFDVA